MINIAITGGMGSGKSVVTSYLAEKGFTVIDADRMSREITGPGGKAMPYILEHFGSSFIREDGGLDRAAMRDLVFRDPDALRLLQKGTTDVVLADIEEIRRAREAAGDRLLFYDIPLLFETGKQDDYDSVWTVTADRETRISRIMERDGTDRNIIELMIGSQAEDDVRKAGSDIVLVNDGTIEELCRAVDEALAEYDFI